jgi:hypothetical protein
MSQEIYTSLFYPLPLVVFGCRFNRFQVGGGYRTIKVAFH